MLSRRAEVGERWQHIKERAGPYWRILKETVTEFDKDNAPLLGAGIAFYALVSMAPLLILVLATLGLVLGDQVAEGRLTATLAEWLGSDAATAITRVVHAADTDPGGIWATLLSAILIFWGATRLIEQLRRSINHVWEVRMAPQGFKKSAALFTAKRFISLLLVFGLGGLLLFSLLVNTVLSALAGFFSEIVAVPTVALRLIDVAISAGLLSGTVGLMFRYLPDAKVRWDDVWPGAILVAAAFIVVKYVFGYYLAYAGFGSAYGAASSLVVVVLWVYVTAQILLFGAELTQVVARHRGHEIRPGKYALRLVETEADDDDAIPDGFVDEVIPTPQDEEPT